MSTTSIAPAGIAPDINYELGAIAHHNASPSGDQRHLRHDGSKGLGIYHGGLGPGFPEDDSYVLDPATPRSNATSDGIQPQSGKPARRTDSAFSVSGSSPSMSPRAGAKKEKKSKADKSKTPKLTAPLSVLTKDMDVPLKDMDAWVHRSSSVRHKEVEKRKGYVTRPMNAFMLYRSAYADRTKQWCSQNNHQVVSAVSGESWPMEPEEVRNQFNEWARLERANHQAAHPDYKFSPSKSTNKRRKSDLSDEEDGDSDGGYDPDGEYRGSSGRRTRQRPSQDSGRLGASYPNSVGFGSHPYFDHDSDPYDGSQYGYRPLPSNVSYDASSGMMFSPQTGSYVSTTIPHSYSAYSYAQDARGVRTSTPPSVNGVSHQNLGGYGLPGSQQIATPNDDGFVGPRSGESMQHYVPQQQHHLHAQYPHTSAAQYATYQTVMPAMYEHQQYLQQASHAQLDVDPGMSFSTVGRGGLADHVGGQFLDAMGTVTAHELTRFHPGYFEESTSPDQTLAPSWEPGDALEH